MQIQKVRRNRKLKPWEVFWYSVAWTAICLGLILIGLFAARFIFG